MMKFTHHRVGVSSDHRRKKRSSHPLRARCASIAVLRLRGLVQRRARPARVIHCLKNLLDSFGALKSNQRENFARRIPRCRARIRGARSCPRLCCTRRKCALATDRRTFVLSPRGRNWLTYLFSARAQVRQSQRGCAASGFCSKAFLACLFRCTAQPVVKRIRGTPRMHG